MCSSPTHAHVFFSPLLEYDVFSDKYTSKCTDRAHIHIKTLDFSSRPEASLLVIASSQEHHCLPFKRCISFACFCILMKCAHIVYTPWLSWVSSQGCRIQEFILWMVWHKTPHFYCKPCFLTCAYDFKIIVYLKVINPFNFLGISICCLEKKAVRSYVKILTLSL